MYPEFSFRPWSRAMDMTKAGRFDAAYNAYYTEDRAKQFHFTDGYFVVELILCALSDRVKFDGTAESLKGIKLGLVYDYANTDAIDSADYLDKHFTTNDRLNFRKLVANRVDAIVIGREQAEYLMATDPVVKAKKGDVRILSPSVAKRSLHLMFSKAVPGWQTKAERFNRGLIEIREDGTLKEVVERWLHRQDEIKAH